ncbi:MAG: four helix bundle suffix domain-containing protein [Candidatus Gottesmanbacteria bacterium]
MSKPGYEYLFTYQNSVEIYDLTIQFCEKFLPGRENLRTREQMVQAARSSKQCIAEGYLQKSLKGYIKLLGVTRGSFEELLKDYEDFVRTNSLEVLSKWDKGVKRDKWGKFLLPVNPINPLDPFIPVNHLINLIRRTNYLLDRQIKSLEDKFIREGGYTENLFKKRLKVR